MPCDEEEIAYSLYDLYDYEFELGHVRLEQWPKGFRLWVKDQYVWQSWEDDDANQC